MVITTNVINKGGEPGSCVVFLRINGKVEQTKTVSVSPRIARPVRFTVTRAQPGIYEVDINGQKSFFTIAGESSGPGSSISGAMIAIIVVGSLVTAFLIYILIIYVRRRQGYY